MVFWVRVRHMYRSSHGSAAVVLEQMLAARRSRSVSAGYFRALALEVSLQRGRRWSRVYPSGVSRIAHFKLVRIGGFVQYTNHNAGGATGYI